MRIDPDRLAGHLKESLAPLYLVFGQEPLIVEESCDAIRSTARANGYTDRTVMTVEAGFSWNQLAQAAQTLSLFSTQRIVELRMPTGRPGESGAKALAQYAAAPAEGTLLLIVTGRLDRAARESKWFKALDAVGGTVACWPVDERRLPEWIGARMRQRGLQPASGVVALLAHCLQGNLLAVAQEIEKLTLLCAGGEVSVEDVQASVADNARFDVYELVDTCLRGDARKAVRMLGSLRAEGVEPALVLWALGREVRTMLRLSGELASGRPRAQAFKAHRIWTNRIPAVTAALKRLRYPQWLVVLRQVGRLDWVLKGRRRGDIWLGLERLSLLVCGVRAV